MATEITAFKDKQMREILRYHNILQHEVKPHITIAEAILNWIVSGYAETFRRNYFVYSV